MSERNPGRRPGGARAGARGGATPDGTPEGADKALEALVALAVHAAGRAHAPYSNFRVGVALRDDRGGVYLGANQENAAYPLGICAERVALRIWRAAGGGPVVALVIHTATERPTPPCGLCRDALKRWAPEARIYLHCRAGLSGPRSGADWLPGTAFDGGRPSSSIPETPGGGTMPVRSRTPARRRSGSRP